MRIESHQTTRQARISPTSPAANQIEALRARYAECIAERRHKAANEIHLKLKALVCKQLRREIRAERRS